VQLANRQTLLDIGAVINFVLTTTIIQVKLGDYFAIIAIGHWVL
jgi:hypothetical protein